MAPRVRILLVRHGQSTWNAAGRWQGQANPPLSDLGRVQARLAAAAIPDVVGGPISAIYASTLQRAAETARIISAELGIDEVHLEPGLRERNAGEWSGLTREEVEAKYPGYLDPTGGRSGFAPSKRPRPPGWEPDAHLHARASAALLRIAHHETGNVLAVTHGGLIYTMEAKLGAPSARLANAGGRWIIASDGGLGLGERVLLLDDNDPRVTVPQQI
jgi:probable phosphoglycerate mutase